MTDPIRFKDVGNYRGNLEIKEEGGEFFWRVNCDVDDEPWMPIPQYLYDALLIFASVDAAPLRDRQPGQQAAPTAQPQPLTIEQIHEMIRELGFAALHVETVVRATEQRHGIVQPAPETKK